MEGHIFTCASFFINFKAKYSFSAMLSKRLIIRTLLKTNKNSKEIYLSNNLDPIPEIDYVEINYCYPLDVFDVISRRVSGRYTRLKEILYKTFLIKKSGQPQ
jgi:hypothetical protein